MRLCSSSFKILFIYSSLTGKLWRICFKFRLKVFNFFPQYFAFAIKHACKKPRKRRKNVLCLWEFSYCKEFYIYFYKFVSPFTSNIAEIFVFPPHIRKLPESQQTCAIQHIKNLMNITTITLKYLLILMACNAPKSQSLVYRIIYVAYIHNVILCWLYKMKNISFLCTHIHTCYQLHPMISK